MLLFYYGTDRIKSRAKAKEAIEQMHKKRPDAEFFTLSTENWQEGSLDELLGAQGLFEKKYIVLCDNLCEKKDIKEIVVGKLKFLKESDNAFVMIENALDAKTTEKIVKLAEKSQEFVGAEKRNDMFNVFGLSENLARRDKKALWVLYHKALKAQIPAEEMFGILFWQIKTLILASQTNSAVEADLKPFVYTKAKAALKNFKEGELQLLSSKLITLYHDARRGIGDQEANLEKFILEI